MMLQVPEESNACGGILVNSEGIWTNFGLSAASSAISLEKNDFLTVAHQCFFMYSYRCRPGWEGFVRAERCSKIVLFLKWVSWEIHVTSAPGCAISAGLVALIQQQNISVFPANELSWFNDISVTSGGIREHPKGKLNWFQWALNWFE